MDTLIGGVASTRGRDKDNKDSGEEEDGIDPKVEDNTPFLGKVKD